MRSSRVFRSSSSGRAKMSPSASIRRPAVRHTKNDVLTDSRTFFSLRAPKCVATSTFTPLPRPIRKPVKRNTSVVVEPTEPMAAELEKRPTARSTMLKSICKRLVNISGREKVMICRPR